MKDPNINLKTPKKNSVLARRQFLRTASAASIFTIAAAGTTTTAEASFFRFSRRYRETYLRRREIRRSLYLRRRRAYRVKTRAAYTEYRYGITLPTPNSDELQFAKRIGNFTKTLPHNEAGEVDLAAYDQLTEALKSGQSSDFDAIPLDPSSARKLANPQAAFTYSLAGGDSHSFKMPPAPGFSSKANASEIGEVYLHALLRDVPFDQYDSDSSVSRAVDQMNEFSDFSGPKENGSVTSKTLFRGETSGDLIGNYISQFLLLPIPESGSTREQTYVTPIQNFDHMTSYSDWLGILKGAAPTTSTTLDPEKRYIATGRDLAEFVHTDFSYQAYLQAALILLGQGAQPQAGNPYINNENQGAFITFGGAEILTSISTVALQGLKAAWYQKWVVHRRLRPEVFGGRIHNQKIGDEDYPIDNEILNSSILDDVFAKHGTYLLPMAYPEGSPTHPAYPAGHAVIAGACCTILKAFFDGAQTLSNPVEVTPGSEGTELRPYSGSETLTVGNELDKLANNISLGRDIAGVHWRTDGTEGIKLGEEVAIRYLRNLKETYTEENSGFSFTDFEGEQVTI